MDNDEVLVRQATYKASVYLAEAVSAIDGVFGDGYAKGHPDLVAAFINACGQDFAASCQRSATKDMARLVFDV